MGQWHVFGKLDADFAAGELPLHAPEGRTNHLVHGLPLAIQRDAAAGKPGHVEQVLHQPRQPLRLLADGFQQFVTHGHIQRIHVLGQTAGRTGDGRQRRAQVVRYGAEQRTAESLHLDTKLRLFRFVGQPDSLQGEGDLRGVRLQQMLCVRRAWFARVLHLNGQHAGDAVGRRHRDVERFGVGKRVGSAARRLVMVEHPLRSGKFGGAGRKGRQTVHDGPDLPKLIGQKDYGVRVEDFGDSPFGFLDQLARLGDGGQTPAETVQGLGAPFVARATSA